VCDRTVWRFCRDNGWVVELRQASLPQQAPARDYGSRRPRAPELHRQAAPNRLWLADITDHPTGEGKLYEPCIAIVSWMERTYTDAAAKRPLGRMAPIDYGMIMTPPAAQAA
jgi:transposase InsO family protein